MSSLSHQVLNSSWLLLATRLVQRSLGLISTLILARLLTPEDFGVVAVAAITINLFVILGVSGSDKYIIQKTEVDDGDLNTAWSIDILLKSFLWLILVMSAPFIDDFVDGASIAPVLWVLSFNLIFEAAQNPGVMLLRKNLQYSQLFRLAVIQKLISFSVVMIIVFIHPTYWAIVFGDVAGAITMLVGTYVIHSYRPRLSLSRIKEQWSFSHWMLFKGVLGYTRSQIDNILVSKLFGAAPLGGYYLSRDISMMPANEIVKPIAEPLLASFARVKQSMDDLAYQVRLSMVVVTAIILPICFFMYYFPEPIVDVLLGEKWVSVYTLFSHFSLLLFTFAIGFVLNNCCIALKWVKGLFFFDLFTLIFITAGLWFLFNESLEDFAWLRGELQVLTTIVLIAIVRYLVPFNLLLTTWLSAPLFVASFCGALATKLSKPYLQGVALWELVSMTAVFFSVYLMVLGLFFIAGFRRFGEYRHVYSLGMSVVKPVIAKIRRHK